MHICIFTLPLTEASETMGDTVITKSSGYLEIINLEESHISRQ